ncbi:hypothetical protein [uncultured Neptuniibacter sp.]|uniref:hypothetical protein n=1 Tax=uncultured Neptuniibacter sp. TaxID=502143 RepID=UPI00262E4990|nr:hypothetical protein [uncultured Neptuniibacter sp.]
MGLADDKKLSIVFRIESGCLGPEGNSHVDQFCSYAQSRFESLFPAYLNWVVVPRHDKTLPEMDFAINGRQLGREHAKRYLAHFDQEIDQFEMNVFDELPEMIDQYFGR